MKPFKWSHEKNQWFLETRGLSFEDVVTAIENGQLLNIIPHPKPEKYPGQRVLVVCLMGYVYLVPFVDEPEYVFLKTLYPSRKATRMYGKDCHDPKDLH